ncbi:MAG: sodium:alanine symporter family protein [Parachlamydiales bacterium]|nr:sodium:alanine symporter family protein [Parachlamydiales bacterium]
MNIFTYIFYFLNYLDTFFWCYIGFILIVVLGIYLSIKHRFFQLFKLFQIFKEFVKISKRSNNTQVGIHPLKVFFSSVGGMIGIGNVVGIITAVQIGGPGALFWVWVAAPLGAIIKYSEIFLGLITVDKKLHKSA